MSKFLEVRKMTEKRVMLVIRFPTDEEVPHLRTLCTSSGGGRQQLCG